MAELEGMQTIPARHGTATFVPQDSTIKIVNTHGTQVIDVWVFALPEPPKSLRGEDGKEKTADGDDKNNKTEGQDVAQKEKKEEIKRDKPKQEKKPEAPNVKKGRKTRDLGLPSQEEAEAATAKGFGLPKQQQEQEQPQEEAGEGGALKRSSWSSYLPSLRGSGKKQQQQQQQQPQSETKDKKENTAQEQQKQNSRAWGSYLSTGQGFTSYLPSQTVISAFANSHHRDPNKSYAEQLADFSKTPVGAASLSMLAGSGTAGSLYSGYSAWNNARGENAAMEFLSLAHTRASTLHLVPQVDDVLVSNLRRPLITLVEDTSAGVHDTLMAACDPQRYRELGVERWEEHGSCAENLVLALKELNQKAGLKGPKGIGADVTINSVPAPLNLFMNIPWGGEKGELEFAAPVGKEKEFVRLRAERDIVVIMSACPQDVIKINGNEPKDGHFVVETAEENVAQKLKAADKKRPRGQPRKLNSNASVPKRSDSIVSATPKKQDRPSQPSLTPPEDYPLPSGGPRTPSGAEPVTTTLPNPPQQPPIPSSSSTTTKSASAPSVAPSSSKPKGKPKKLVDPQTGEKKKPRKLEKRTAGAGGAAPTPSNGTPLQAGS